MNSVFPSEIWLTFSGQINEATNHQIVSHFCAAIERKAHTIHFLIQSPGGVIADGVALYNYLINLPVNLITYNIGGVKSVAVLPFLAGKRRIATDTAVFMIHKSGTSIEERVPAWFLRQRAHDLEMDDLNTESILKKHIVMPDEKWEEYRLMDLNISAQQALEFSFIHEISLFKPATNDALFHVS